MIVLTSQREFSFRVQSTTYFDRVDMEKQVGLYKIIIILFFFLFILCLIISMIQAHNCHSSLVHYITIKTLSTVQFLSLRTFVCCHYQNFTSISVSLSFLISVAISIIFFISISAPFLKLFPGKLSIFLIMLQKNSYISFIFGFQSSSSSL